MKEFQFEGFGYRLIPSRFPSVEVYQGLVANHRFPALYELEAETNPRLQGMERLRAEYGGDGSAKFQNWNHAPFRYFNPEGTRFFRSTRPALELAGDTQTALIRAVRRREVFLRRTQETPLGIDMRMLKTPVKGNFADFRDAEIELDEESRRALGDVVSDELAGAAFLAPERAEALCLAVTKPSALGTSIQTVHYRFEWDGQRIAKIYEFTEKGSEWDPDELAAVERVIAA